MPILGNGPIVLAERSFAFWSGVATCIDIQPLSHPRFGSLARRTDNADPKWSRRESIALFVVFS
jgi:hypothetical protein